MARFVAAGQFPRGMVVPWWVTRAATTADTTQPRRQAPFRNPLPHALAQHRQRQHHHGPPPFARRPAAPH